MRTRHETDDQVSIPIAVGIMALGLLLAVSLGNTVWGALLGVAIMFLGFALYRWG